MLPDEEALKQYRVKVHGIKASAMLVGQMSLAGMARVLELAAINHSIDIIEAVHDTFVSQLIERKNQLKPLFDTDNSNTQDLVDINKDLLFEQLEILIQAVSDVDVDRADEIVDILRGFDYPDDIRSKMDEIYSAVINLDENLISEIISEIKTKI